MIRINGMQLQELCRKRVVCLRSIEIPGGIPLIRRMKNIECISYVRPLGVKPM